MFRPKGKDAHKNVGDVGSSPTTHKVKWPVSIIGIMHYPVTVGYIGSSPIQAELIILQITSKNFCEVDGLKYFC